MIVLSPTYPGLIHECEYCHAILAYTQEDVWENEFIYCPLCHTKNKVRLNLGYEGEVTNDGSKDS